MANELVNISDQFKGLPMADLIGGPLDAACDAQIKLAAATENFIRTIGFLPDATDPTKTGETRTALFKFTRPYDDLTDPADPKIGSEEVTLEVPLLAIVNVPNLAIKNVDITFDMEVKSSFSQQQKDAKSGSVSASAQFGFGCFSAKVSIKGSISSSKEQTRKSDNSAKYHVEVHASDDGMPEGLSRVMDILQSAAVPKSIAQTPA